MARYHSVLTHAGSLLYGIAWAAVCIGFDEITRWIVMGSSFADSA